MDNSKTTPPAGFCFQRTIPQEITAAKAASVKSFGNGGPVDLREGLCRNPLWPIWERPIPTTTDVHSEEVWPTQPFPTVLSSISRQTLSEKDVNPYLDPAEAQAARK